MTNASADITPGERDPKLAPTAAAAAAETKLYLVATSHLDTQWRWSVRTSIRHFLRRTVLDNLDRFRRFPNYILSFEGALRYQLIEEYFPALFDRLKNSVAEGRWRVAGSMLDAPDTVLPAPESLIRHILYGNGYFDRTFGERSHDLFLPDCFGFPASLPTIAVHCGLSGFSSQKLIKWFAPKKLPFDIGLWQGPDGAQLIAVLNPGGYSGILRSNLAKALPETPNAAGRAVPGYRYFGVGDRGGAPDPTTLDWVEASATTEAGADVLRVIPSGSDDYFKDLTAAERERLPIHEGDLLLPTHGTGGWTSHAVLKDWNRRCERLALAAEKAALAADWLGGPAYPREQFEEDWTRFLWHQMHDDITGTSAPEAYQLTWNDLLLTQSRLATRLEDSVQAVTRQLDTDTRGVPLVLFNPLGVERCETVEVWLDLSSMKERSEGTFIAVSPDGKERPVQLLERRGDRARLLFVAEAAALSFSVLEVRAGPSSKSESNTLSVSTDYLECSKYRLEVSPEGAIERLFDKTLDRDLLAEPLDFVFLPDRSSRWPAWEIRYDDLAAAETPFGGLVEAKVVESGPIRAAIELTRKTGRTTLKQRLELDAVDNPGRRLRLRSKIDWQHRASLLKAKIALASAAGASIAATLDQGIGVSDKAVNSKKSYETPAHEWADLATDGRGLSVLTSGKYGWDRPAANTLRLSLLRSPAAFRRFAHQATQDLGRHKFDLGLLPHKGSWREAGTLTEAAKFNDPLLAFQPARHPGALGKDFSVLEIEADGALLMALKKAENDEAWIARVRETRGRSTSFVGLQAPNGIRAVEELDGSELRYPNGGRGTIDQRHVLKPFSIHTYRIESEPNRADAQGANVSAVRLPFNQTAASFHGYRAANFDGRGFSLPGELMPERVQAGEIAFELGLWAPDAHNVVSCRGQVVELPEGEFDTFHILACSTNRRGSVALFQCGKASTRVDVPFYGGFLGQWKRFKGRLGYLARSWQPGYLEHTPVAWVGTHRHNARVRDEVYSFCYLFRLEIPLTPGTNRIVFPNATSVKVFSAAVSESAPWHLRRATALFDPVLC